MNCPQQLLPNHRERSRHPRGTPIASVVRFRCIRAAAKQFTPLLTTLIILSSQYPPSGQLCLVLNIYGCTTVYPTRCPI